MVRVIWERSLKESIGVRREQTLAVTLGEVEFALGGHRGRDDVLEGFHLRGSIRPGADGAWMPVPVEH